MLRAPELSDVDLIYNWENDPERLLHGRTGLPYSKNLITEYIRNYNETALGSGQLRFIIAEEDKNDGIGMADLYDLDMSARKAFVSIYISKDSRKKGNGNHSLQELISFCRDQLGLLRLVAIISSENIASQKLFEKNKFQKLARLPQWVRGGNGNLVDAYLYDLYLDKYD